MKTIYRLVLAFTVLSLGACASTETTLHQEATDSELEAYCQTVSNCRENVRVVLRTEGQTLDTLLPLYWPPVGEFGVSLLPGEELFVEAEIDGDTIGGFKHVSTIVNPEKTFRFRFRQEKDVGMMLSVQNPFDVVIKYNIDMIDFQGNPHETSSCPLIPNGGAYESWPHAIPEIHITNFRVLQADDGFICEY